MAKIKTVQLQYIKYLITSCNFGIVTCSAKTDLIDI